MGNTDKSKTETGLGRGKRSTCSALLAGSEYKYHAVNKRFLESIPKKELVELCLKLGVTADGWGREKMARFIYPHVNCDVLISFS